MSKNKIGVNGGFLGVGIFKSRVNKKETVEYMAWKNMMKRCYKLQKAPIAQTYKGCTVHEDWHNFQNFAEWYTSQLHYGLGYELDKDILVVGNKVYSAETCCLVPSAINHLLSARDASRGDCKLGVSLHKKSGKFTAQLQVNGKSKYLGIFNNEDDAHDKYKEEKERYVRSMALDYKDDINEDVFLSLMNWRVEVKESDDE